MTTEALPLVGVSACLHRRRDDLLFHNAAEPYFIAVRAGAGALPLMIPSLPQSLDPDTILARLDGLLVSGSASNVEPRRYGGPPAREGTRLDPQRDAATLPLIRAAIGRGLPLLAICRGSQEMNVALGGTLFQHLQEEPGRLDHRAGGRDSLEAQFAPRHDIEVRPGGRLAAIAGTGTFKVNSLHGQAVDRLGAGLTVEAVAPDGTIEAFSAAAGGFALAVQFHPEWRVRENPLYLAIFEAFGAAVRLKARDDRLASGGKIEGSAGLTQA